MLLINRPEQRQWWQRDVSMLDVLAGTLYITLVVVLGISILNGHNPFGFIPTQWFMIAQ